MKVLSRSESREIDRHAIEQLKIPGILLMENAGRGTAELLMGLQPACVPICILCGWGNNGGDGFVIARHLANRGYPIEIICCSPEDQSFEASLSNDARVNFEIARNLRIPIRFLAETPDFKHRDWIVDALFGTGLNRPLESPFAEIIEAMNSSGKPILAVDIPSGLDCDSGLPLGPTVRAAHTATFVALKKGFLNPASREFTGRTHIIDIGIAIFGPADSHYTKS